MRSIYFVAIFQCLWVSLMAQDLKPGLPGMAPMKFITIKNTHAPGRVYQGINGIGRTYTVEDTYFKAWIPAVVTSRFALAIAPQYRTELFELKSEESRDIESPSVWKLRSAGIDIKSIIRLNHSSWLINTGNFTKSGDVAGSKLLDAPLSFTVSSVYLKRYSTNTEFGFGLMANKANHFLVLPVIVYNHNFSPRSGIEISFPHKLAWRYNLSKSDILYAKAEASTRSYYISRQRAQSSELFRRIDVDLGIAYNKQFTSFMGVELFAGYRQNISNALPNDVKAVTNSGWVGSLEIYITPPAGIFRKGR